MNLANELIGSMLTPVVAISASGIVATCFSVILRMTPKTDHLIRIFYTTISAGAFGELCLAFSGRVPDIPETLIVLGIGMLFMFDRRAVCRARLPNCRSIGKKVTP